MTVDEAVETAISLIKVRDYVSFAELEREIPDFGGENSNILITIGGKDVIWQVTKFGSAVFTVLEPLVALHPSSLELYLIDGKLLNFKKPYRFTPMTLRLRLHTDFIGPNGRALAIGNDKELWAAMARTLGKKAVNQGRRLAEEERRRPKPLQAGPPT